MTGRSIRVFGHVQGVFYRAWTLQQAQLLGLKGWVRNRRDGSVEIEAWGDPAAIAALIEKCRQGPSQARVERITDDEIEGEPPPGFRAASTI
ncbi:MAG TPA: acylphosphatase [Allosphingosinicella sp.]|nr:acylphosphatase [Allosphingosinicella sp.]